MVRSFLIRPRRRTPTEPSPALRRSLPAVCLLLGALTLYASPAHAAAFVPQPDQDPFYAVPANLGPVQDGTVLDSRSVQAMALAAPIPASAWQVKFKTIDQDGRPSASVTTILVPTAPWTGSGPRPLLSYQVAVDSLSRKCSPSFVLRAGTEAGVSAGPTVLQSNAEDETANITQAVSRGFAVAVPDWEGPEANWVGADGAARSVLDGLRAVRHFTPAGVSASAPTALVGYSGGALATDWALQLQPSYAPELRSVGAALGGTPAELKASIVAFNANPGARGAIALLLAAFQRSYPSWNVGNDLSPVGRTAVANSQHDCLLDALIRNEGVDTASYEASPGAIFNNSQLDKLLASVSPLHYPGVPRAPILFYHSQVDELAPIGEMYKLAARFCADGLPVHVVTSPAGEHIASVLSDFPIALNYIADRFAGKPIPNDCASAPTPPATSGGSALTPPLTSGTARTSPTASATTPAAADSATSGGALAFTGVDPGVAALAALLVAAGGAGMALRRRLR